MYFEVNNHNQIAYGSILIRDMSLMLLLVFLLILHKSMYLFCEELCEVLCVAEEYASFWNILPFHNCVFNCAVAYSLYASCHSKLIHQLSCHS